MRQCLFCDLRARSGEHIFPASLGGRRINRGIYCEEHNNHFSSLVGELAQQLKVINSLLSVRHDREKQARPYEYLSPDGEKIKIFGGKTIRSEGFSEKPIHLSLTLGGPDGLRALAYVALTFLAHGFPDVARASSTRHFRRYVFGEEPNDFIWWEKSKLGPSAISNPFEFGHTIAFFMDANAKLVTAYISLFQTINFGIRIGSLELPDSRSRCYFIDPLAEHPPQDMREFDSSEVLLYLSKPEPLQAHLIEMVAAGASKNFQELTHRIERWSFEKEMEPKLKELNNVRETDRNNLPNVTLKFAEESQKHIFRLMLHVAENARKSPEKTGVFVALQGLLGEAVRYADESKSTLTAFGEACFIAAIMAIRKEILSRLENRELSMDDLFEVLSSGSGAAIVLNAIVNHIVVTLLHFADLRE